MNGNSATHELHQVAQTLIKTARLPFSNLAISSTSFAVTETRLFLSQALKVSTKHTTTILYNLMDVIINLFKNYGLFRCPTCPCIDIRPEPEQTGEKLGIISGMLSKSSLILSYTSDFEGKS